MLLHLAGRSCTVGITLFSSGLYALLAVFCLARLTVGNFLPRGGDFDLGLSFSWSSHQQVYKVNRMTAKQTTDNIDSKKSSRSGGWEFMVSFGVTILYIIHRSNRNVPYRIIVSVIKIAIALKDRCAGFSLVGSYKPFLYEKVSYFFQAKTYPSVRFDSGSDVYEVYDFCRFCSARLSHSNAIVISRCSILSNHSRTEDCLKLEKKGIEKEG